MDNKILEKAKNTKMPEGYPRNGQFSWKKHCRLSNRLLYFCVGKERIITISSVIEKIGIDYGVFVKALYSSTPYIDFYFQPFYDQEYLSPVGDVKEVICKVDYLLNFLKSLGFEEKKSKNIIDGGKEFEIETYEQYVIDRLVQRSKAHMSPEEYYEKIDLYPKNCESFEADISEVDAMDSVFEHVEENRKNPTNAELKMKKILEENSIEFEYQKPVKIGKSVYIMDFFLPKKNMCIEIDGNYHNEQSQLLKDKIRDIRMTRYGIFVVRFHNSEVGDMFNTVESFLNSVAGYKNVKGNGFISCNYPTEGFFMRRD